MVLQVGVDLFLSLQMLFHGVLVQLRTGKNGQNAHVLHVIVDKNANGSPHLVSSQNSLIFHSFQQRVNDVLFVHLYQVFNVASVQVFFISLFYLLHHFVIQAHLFLIFSHDFLQNEATLRFDADKGKYLVDDVGLCVFLRIFKLQVTLGTNVFYFDLSLRRRSDFNLIGD